MTVFLSNININVNMLIINTVIIFMYYYL